MELTKETLNELFTKFEALTSLQEMIDIKFNNAYVENKDREIVIIDGEEEIKTTEKVAWEEMKVNALNKRATEALSKIYPDIFENVKQEKEMLKDINAFENEIFGFTTERVSRFNLIKLIQAIIKLEKGE